jgi:hypothetical protein
MNMENPHLGNLGKSPITGQPPSRVAQAAMLRGILVGGLGYHHHRCLS